MFQKLHTAISKADDAHDFITSLPSPTIIGNIGNILVLLSTVAITTCMLYQLPTTEYYDDSWLSNGFCVSNEDTLWKNSHLLSFYSDTLFTIIVLYLCWKSTSTLSASSTPTPPLQTALLYGSIMSIFGHGCGHAYLGIEPTGMDLRFTTTKEGLISTFVSFVAFCAIFNGALPLATPLRLVICSFIATSGFTLLDIPPKFNFIYAQAVIYIFSTLHMLTLDMKHKLTASYMLYPYAQFPVLLVGVLEATQCTYLLKDIGGHMIFDTAISVGFVMIHFVSEYLENDPKFRALIKANGGGTGGLKSKIIKRV